MASVGSKRRFPSRSSGAACGTSPSAVPILCHERDLLDFGVDVDTATASAINRAYRRKALEAHPDKGGGADEFRRLKSKSEELQRCFKVFETYKRKHPDIVFADCVERERSSQRRSHLGASAPTAARSEPLLPPVTAPPWHVATILQATLPNIAEALDWLRDDMLEVGKNNTGANIAAPTAG